MVVNRAQRSSGGIVLTPQLVTAAWAYHHLCPNDPTAAALFERIRALRARYRALKALYHRVFAYEVRGCKLYPTGSSVERSSMCLW